MRFFGVSLGKEGAGGIRIWLCLALGKVWGGGEPPRVLLRQCCAVSLSEMLRFDFNK